MCDATNDAILVGDGFITILFMKTNPFFIIGSQRGGTTLLRLMLNRHSEILVPQESHFFITLLQQFAPQQNLTKEQQYLAAKIVYEHPRFEGWEIDKNQLDGIVELLPESCHLSDFIRSIFEYKLNGKKIWGDKTPEYIDIIPAIKKLFPEARFILLIRDGRDVSASLKERGWQGWTIYQRAKYWKKCMRKIFSLTKNNTSTLLVRYEDLVLESQKCLIKICNFLNVEYEDAMMEFYKNYDKNITLLEMQSGIHTKLERPPIKDDVFKWKHNLIKEDVWKFESVCYRELLNAGYEISYFKKLNLFHQLAAMVYAIYGLVFLLIYKFYHSFFSKNQKIKNRETFLFTTLRQVVRKQ